MDGASPTNICILPYLPLKVLRDGYAMQCKGSIHPKVGKTQVLAKLVPSCQRVGSSFRLIHVQAENRL
jgi:hypothetical protein